jgi:hypothetical protein
MLAVPVATEQKLCPHCGKEYQIPEYPQASRTVCLQRFRTHKCECPNNPKKRKAPPDSQSLIQFNNTTLTIPRSQIESDPEKSGTMNVVNVLSSNNTFFGANNCNNIISLSFSWRRLCANEEECQLLLGAAEYLLITPPIEYQELIQTFLGITLINLMHSLRKDATHQWIRTTILKQSIKLLWMIHKFNCQCATPNCLNKINKAQDVNSFDCDHLNPEEKTLCISSLVISNYAPITLIQELDKCQLLCITCHRVKSAQQRRDARKELSNNQISESSNHDHYIANISNNSSKIKNYSIFGTSSVALSTKTLGARKRV